MDVEFSVRNPSEYPRAGHVTVHWSDPLAGFQHNPDRISLFREEDAVTQCDPLPAQLDLVGLPSQSDYVLSFTLPDRAPVQSGEEVRLVLKEQGPSFRVERYIPPSGGSPPRIDLYNDRLFVSHSLAPSHGAGDTACFGGAAQSVRLRDLEFLEPFALDLSAHDREKRCMQIDRLRIWPGQAPSAVEHSLFDKHWELVSSCAGPVRTVCTIAQRLAPSPDAATLQFCRVLSLFVGRDYILDELSIGGAESDAATFSPRYFANMDMTPWPDIFRDEPPCLSIGYDYGERRPGYGFAADAPVVAFSNPHPGYPNGVSRKERTFSWEVERRARTKCLHVFMHGGDLRGRTGRLWHEEIQAPLLAAF